ncbi:T9SS type A sorting domain-containing protein [Hymenobacter jeongseonensis]|nr:T9SS type A sorting domain-containing protein [Hymenobacter jeongseonensis]
MEDIDISTLATGGSDFVDEVTFNAYTLGSTTPYTLTAADIALGSNGSNTFVTGTNTIKGLTVNGGPAGTVVLTYPAGIAISRLEIIYRNTQTFTTGNLRLQTIGIPSMVWCAEIDLATTLTGPGYVQAGQPVAYTAVTKNQGDLSAAGVVTSVQLTAGLTNVTVNNLTTGFTYNSTSGLLTYTIGSLAVGISDTRTIRFTMPATGSVTGKASSTTAGLDIEPVNNNGSLANANVTTVQNQPPVVEDVAATPMPNTNGATAIPALVGTDPNGNNTIVSYLLTNLPLTTQGVVTFTRGGATVTLLPGNTSSLANRTLTPAEMATLRFDPTAGFLGNAIFNYTATDDFAVVSNTATYTIPVGPVGDVYAVFTAPATTPTTGLAGSTQSFTVQFGNNGPNSALVTSRVVTIPAGVSGVTQTGGVLTGSAALGWTITYPVGTFATGTSSNFTFSFVTPASGSVDLVATTTTTSNQGANTAPDSDTQVLNVTPLANVATTVTATPAATVNAGAPLSFAVTYTNAGPSTAAGYAQTLQLTAGLGLANVTFANVPAGVTPVYNNTTGAVTFTGAPTSLASGANQNLTVNIAAVPAALASVTATSTVATTTSENGAVANNTDFKTVTVTPIANVATTVTATPAATVNAGAPLSFAVTYTNAGPSTAAGYAQTLTLTAGLGTVTFANTPAGVTAVYNNANGVVTFTGAPTSLASGANQNLTVNIAAVPAALASVTATSTVATTTSENGAVANNSASATVNVTPVADVYAVFTAPAASPTTGLAGSVQNFTVQFGNNGPSSAVVTSRVVTIPAGVPSVTQTGGTLSGNATTGWTITYPVGTVATGTSTDYSFSIVAPATGPVNLVATTATTTSQNGATANDTDTQVLNVTPVADVATTVTATPATTVNAGAPLSFAVTYTNAGPSTAAGYTQTLTLTAGLGAANVTFANTPAGVTPVYNNTTGNVTFTGRPTSLASGANQNLTVNIAAVPAALASVTATSVTNTTTSENGATANNSDTKTVNVTPIADVYAVFTAPAASPTTGLAGSTQTFTVQFGNNGPSPAVVTSRVVTIPAGVSGVTQTGGTLSGSAALGWTITYPVGTFATGTSSNFTFGFVTPATGSVDLVATTATTTSQNGATANDSDTQVLNVTPVADVATTITGPSSILQGLPTGNFTAVFTNNGPSTAATVTRTVTLPTGASLTNDQRNTITAAYPGTTFTTVGIGATEVTTINFGTLPTEVVGGTASFVFAFTAPAATTNVTITSNTSTVTSQNGATANDQSQLPLTVTPVADVYAVFTAPATTPTTGLAGSTQTFTVEFGNNGPSSAAGVTRVVTIPAGVPSVTQTGGTLTGSATLGWTITYPGGTFATGTSTNYSFSIVAPATGPVSLVATTTTTTNQNGATANDADTQVLDVTPVADVTTTIAGPLNLVPNSPSGIYTAVFTNNGPSTAIDVTQQVTLPAGVTTVFVNGVAYTPTNNVIDFGPAATLAAGASNTFEFSFTAPATAGSVALVSSVSSATNEGANVAPNTATLNVTVLNTADVVATIAPAAATVTAGQTGTFNVTFQNNGPADAAGVIAHVQLPIGLVGVTVSGNGTYNSATGLVTYAAITSLASNASTASVITFTVPAVSPVTATASISTTTSEGGQKANNVANASINITPTFDVTTLITGPAITAVGVQTTFSIATINNGPSAAPNVVQTVTGLPINLTNVYVSNDGIYDAAAGTVTFPSLGTLADDAHVNNTISFTPTTASATGFTATATATSNGTNANDFNTANNSALAATMVVNPAPAPSTNANLYTLISTPAANVLPGAVTTFTVTSGNNGPGTATTVAQLVTLPAGLTGVVVKDNLGAVLAGAYNPTTGVVTFPTVASLLSSNSVQYTIGLVAPATGVIAAVATVSAATADIMPSNNIATADVTVTPVTDVTVRLTGPNQAPAGSPATYTVTTTNNGPATATNVATAVSIPAGLTGVVVSGGGTYDAISGLVTFPASATLLNGISVANTIEYITPNIATFTNIASVTSTTIDNVVANNTAKVTTAAAGVADVVVAINGPATVVQGNEAVYYVSSINNGTVTAIASQVRVQLPTGLTGVSATNGTYNAATGIVTFDADDQEIGANGAISNQIRFVVPASFTTLYAVATASTTSEESSYANNSAGVVTTVLPATTGLANLRMVIDTSPNTVAGGEALTITVTSTNLVTSTVDAINVVQRVALQPGLIVGNITNGGTYDAVTGVVTFPTLAVLADGASVVNSFVITAPGVAVSTRGVVSGDQSDPTDANNVDTNGTTVNVRTDVTTSVTGPAAAQPGELVTYSVVALNNGPNSALNAVQKVTLPAGATNIVAPNGTISGTTITYSLGTLGAGVNSQEINTITFNAPAGFATSYDVTSSITTTRAQTATGLTNDQATFTTYNGNIAPVANAVTNVLFGPEGNTAIAQAISSLSGTDADGNATIASYAITTIPTAAQGVLSLNGTPVSVNQVIAVGDIAKLEFNPASGFVGNAFFTYTVLDNAGATSAPAIYTIPVGQDLNSVYTATPMKGGNANPYQNGDVVAYGIDPNTATYNTAGLIYKADGTLAAGLVENGIRFGKLSEADSTLLATVGIRYTSETGLFTVVDRNLLPIAGRTIPVSITTVDLFGGINVVPFNIALGVTPLPVELTVFTAQAVKNVDAQLTWRTASEKNNDFFDVERSLNGKDFITIGQVQGQGSTSSATAYALTDAGIGPKAAGLVYYRLRQVDFDGTATYSPVRTVTFTKALASTPAISVFPNPATAATTLDLSQLPAGTYQVSLLDATGRVVLGATLNAGLAHALELQTLASGTYTVLVRGQHGGQMINLTKRLIKE